MSVHPRVPERRATIYDVALRAGVSHQTVARLLRGETVRTTTRELVERALTDLDYRPNETARALATNQSRRIGAFIHTAAQSAPKAIIDGASDEARQFGYVLDLVAVDTDDPTGMEQAVATMATSQLAGVIVIAVSDAMLKALDASRLSCPVIFQHTAQRLDGPGGDPDFALGVDHLLKLGHRRFFFIAGPQDWPASRSRRSAFHAMLEAAGATCVAEAHGNWSAESGHTAMAQMFDPAACATAIVCANDQMALGALNWLAGAGIGVPSDVSVLGFDGQPDAAFYIPPLTTVAVDYEAYGRSAIQQLFRHIGVESRQIRNSAELVVRCTTAGPPVPTS